MSKTSITGPWFKTTKDRLEETKELMKNRGQKDGLDPNLYEKEYQEKYCDRVSYNVTGTVRRYPNQITVRDKTLVIPCEDGRMVNRLRNNGYDAWGCDVSEFAINEAGKGTVWKEIPFLFFASLLLGFLANDIIFFKNSASFISRGDGVVFLIFFIFFIIYSFRIAKPSDMPEEVPEKEYTVGRSVFLILIGLVGLSLGGKFIVDSAVEIARRFGMDEVLIGLTVVAIGTTLPEIATSVVAVYKGKMDIAIGNVVGSNIFNILLVLGISSVIRPIPFHSVENVSMLVVILASFLLFVTMFTLKKNKLDRREGVIFLLLYAGYLGYLLFQRG